jgi:hypothetical protein
MRIDKTFTGLSERADIESCVGFFHLDKGNSIETSVIVFLGASFPKSFKDHKQVVRCVIGKLSVGFDETSENTNSLV